MAEIQNNSTPKSKRKRALQKPVRIDMTPMVDLAFLLLTFFVLSATFSKPKSMELSFPVPEGDPLPLKNGITFLLGKNNRIFYYEGEFRTQSSAGNVKTELHELDFTKDGQHSLSAYLREKNKKLQEQVRGLAAQHRNKQLPDTAFKRLVKQSKAAKEAFTYLVKTDDKATYKNVIDVIDELNINLVGKYVIADIMKPELDLLREKN